MAFATVDEDARPSKQVVAAPVALPSRTQGIDRTAEDGIQRPAGTMAARSIAGMGRRVARRDPHSGRWLSECCRGAARLDRAYRRQARLGIWPLERLDVPSLARGLLVTATPF